jgi:AcrR family transcriptional regulator
MGRTHVLEDRALMPRTKSAKAHVKVLEASLKLFAKQGIDATSMDAIAAESGVSKATIYKHWPDKDRLCLEALGYLHGVGDERPAFDSGDVRADLIAQLGYQPPQDRSKLKVQIMPHMMAYASRHRDFAEVWRARVVENPSRELKAILERGADRGQLSKKLDIDFGISMLLGPMIYKRMFIKRFGGTLPENFVEQVVETFMARYGTP